MTENTHPFRLTAGEIERLLDPRAPLFPELEAASSHLDALRQSPQAALLLAQTEPSMAALQPLPQTLYTLYRLFQRTGDRKRYEGPYFDKRANLSAAALRLFLGQTDLKDIVQDYIWSICEESNWVLPAHEMRLIDLFSAETGFELADIVALLGDTLDYEVRHRVRLEVEKRILDPYLRFHESFGWYRCHNNWNGVCNSSVAATFLLLEPEPGRVARAIEIALTGLDVFLSAAFEQDGSSTEGVAYWHYGLINYVVLSEMLRARSRGAIDLLSSERMRRIAAYPAKMLLSGPCFASFSDCAETVSFSPGIIARLAGRTGERSLLTLLADPARIDVDWRVTMMLRNLLWWDGRWPEDEDVGDAVLPVGGVARLAGRTAAGAPVVLAIKAGHNAENHNQNDVGSFILHVAGENLLTDPGCGLYSRAYFSDHRYENIFANSYGHSVPRIGGRLQEAGPEFRGELVSVETGGSLKRAEVELARAYPVEGLAGARRRVTLAADGARAGTVWLEDSFAFEGPCKVEEALITWLEVQMDGDVALLYGQTHCLKLTIEAPAGAQFGLERLEEASAANDKPGVLKRLTFVVPAAHEAVARIRMEITPAG